MTIEDGAFVTIDTEHLDCGLKGCSAPADVKKVDTHKQLGYHKPTGKVVVCGDVPVTKPTPKPAPGPGPKPTGKSTFTKPGKPISTKPVHTYTKPKTTFKSTKPPSKDCPATCHGHTCDHWIEEVSYTCDSLESNYDCDCGGCACKVD